MISGFRKIAIASMFLIAVAFPCSSFSPALADSPPAINANTDPEILKKYLAKCNALIAQNKATAKVYGSKAQLLEWLNDNKSAVNVYTKALKLDPGNVGFVLGKALAYRKMYKHEDAEREYTRAIGLGSEGSVAYTGRCLARLALKKYKLALLDANKAVQKNSNEKLAWYAKGSAEAYLGRYKQSIRSLSKAIQLNPREPNFLLRRSEVYMQIGDKAKANEDLTLVRKLNKGNQ